MGIHNKLPDLKTCVQTDQMTADAISPFGGGPPRCFLIHLHEDGQDGSVEQWIRNHATALRQTPVLVVLGAREDVCPEDREWLKSLGAVTLKLGAGDMSLLCSHCIVLMHHYLDNINHGKPDLRTS